MERPNYEKKNVEFNASRTQQKLSSIVRSQFIYFKECQLSKFLHFYNGFRIRTIYSLYLYKRIFLNNSKATRTGLNYKIKTANNRSIVLISNDNLRMKLAQFENVTDGSHGFCFKKEHKRPLKK